METLKHTVWALALLVIVGILSLSFKTAWMENYTFWLIIAGVVALLVLAHKQLNWLNTQWEWKERALDNELKRKKEWVEFETKFHANNDREEELKKIDNEYALKHKRFEGEAALREDRLRELVNEFELKSRRLEKEAEFKRLEGDLGFQKVEEKREEK